MNRPLDHVIALQQALDELAAARERLEGIPDWMSDLHEQHSAKKAEMDELAAEIDSAGGERRAAEGEAQEHEEKLKTYQAQISQVRNQREYGALLHEIDAAKQRIKDLEDAGLASIERQDAARRSLDEHQASFEELDQKYKAELEKWEAEKPDVAEQIEKLEGRVEALREQLPKNILMLFDRIHERYSGQALSAVQSVERVGKQPQIWSCSTCNYRVRPQAVVEIGNRGTVVTCDSCKRILYLEDEGSA